MTDPPVRRLSTRYKVNWWRPGTYAEGVNTRYFDNLREAHDFHRSHAAGGWASSLWEVTELR